MFKVLSIAGLIALAQGYAGGYGGYVYDDDYTYAPAPPSGPSPPAPSNSAVQVTAGIVDANEVTSKTASAVQVTAGATMIAAIATLL